MGGAMRMPVEGSPGLRESARRSMSRAFEQAQGVYRREGARELVRRARFQLVKHDIQHLYVLRLAEGEEGLHPQLASVVNRLRRRFEVTWMTPDSRDALSDYLAYRSDLTQTSVEEWLEAGHTAVIVRDRGRIVGDGWIAVRSFPFPDLAMAESLEQRGYAFTYLANVLPEYGGLGVFPLIVDEQLRAARRADRSGLIGTVSPNNRLSGRSVEKMGFRAVGSVGVWWIVGRKWARARLDKGL